MAIETIANYEMHSLYMRFSLKTLVLSPFVGNSTSPLE